MKWIKHGVIFATNRNHDWMQTHAQVPVVDKVNNQRLRIYFGTRDQQNRTLTTYIEVAADDPKEILYVHDKPILPLGKIGCFDDSGVMPSWIETSDHTKYLYYVGWNVGSPARYRVANGVALSEDGGKTFRRFSDGPMMDRTFSDPISVSTQCVLKEDNVWKTWYMSYTKWEEIHGITEPSYHIKYAESEDGIHWTRKNIICIDYASSGEGGLARPSVIKERDIYKMWYSYRGTTDYRTGPAQSYRIGYAESYDGIHWTRKDGEVGISVSEIGWDSEMIAYPCVYNHQDKLYMLYNGNGFGQSGFGYAVLENE